jgi:ABC-type transport system substrate-binding protein
MKFSRFNDYWMKGRPYLDAVVLKFMPEYNTAKNALLSHQVDAINWPDNADLDTLAATKGLELHPYSQNAVMYVAMNTKHAPLDNVMVRKAIALATSRDAYNSALYKNRAKIAYSPILSSSPYYKKGWEYAKDVAKAKQLLAQAGYPNGFSIHILALKSPEEIMGEVLQADLAAIGIKGIIDVTEVPVALDAIFNKMTFDFALLGDVTSPDPDLFASKYFVADGQAAGGTGRWDNPQVKDLIVKGRGTIDMAARVKIYQQAYDIIYNEVPMVFLAYPVRAPVTADFVKGWFAWGDIRYDWPSIWLNK